VFTDKRLVFLRDPVKYERPYKFSGGRFATLADWEYWTNKSNKVVDAGAKEFFEIPYTEVDKIKSGKELSRIIVNDGKNKFRFVVDTNVGKILAQLQKGDSKIQPLICFEELPDNEEE
jgi:hypothetical protein